jgi:WD40 repeat protein
MAFSRDGTTLATGYVYVRGYFSDGGVIVWDVAGRNRVMQAPLPTKESQVSGVAFAPDGKTLAASYLSGPRRGGVVLWDVAGPHRAAETPLPVTDGWVSVMVFSPDSRTLATAFASSRVADGDGGLQLREVAGRKLGAQVPLALHGGEVQALKFSPGGETLTAIYFRGARHGGSVVSWDVAGRRVVAEDALPETKGRFDGVALSRDGKTLAAAFSSAPSSSDANGIVLWDVPGHKPMTRLNLSLPDIWRQKVAFSPDDRTLFAVSDRPAEVTVSRWDVAEEKLIDRLTLPVTYGTLGGGLLSPDGKTLAVPHSFPRGLTQADGVLLWDLTGGGERK